MDVGSIGESTSPIDIVRTRPRASAFLTAARTPRGLVAGFVAVHVAYLLSLLPTILSGGAEGDLPLYREWAMAALGGEWVGIDTEWVYPAGALAPIMAAIALGPALFQLVWLLLTAAGNFWAIWALTAGFRNRRGYVAAWYWLLIEVLLAPVSMLRLEGIAAPFAIVGLVVLARRPAVAGVLIAAATWIKVWPAAIAAAAFVGSPRRLRFAAGGLALTAGIAAAVAAAGGADHLFGFLGMQTDRALQLEAVITTPWVWGAVVGARGTFIYQNWALETREVAGPGAAFAADLVGAAMPIAFVAVVVLLAVARVRADRALMPLQLRGAWPRLVALGAFALTAVLIVFNKVGSPQYLLWLAPIAAVGLLLDERRWTPLTWVLGGTSFLTSLVFPILYMPLVDGEPISAGILTARNLALVAMLAWSIYELARVARRPVLLLR